MTVVILLEDQDQIGPDLRWPLRIAAELGDQTIVIAPGAERSQEIPIDLTGESEQPSRISGAAARLRREDAEGTTQE